MEPIHRSNVKIDERNIALGQLLSKTDDQLNLPYGDLGEVEKLNGINRNTISTIWNRHKNGEQIGNRRSKGGKRKGDKTKNILNKKLTKIDISKRGNIRSLSNQLDISVGTIHHDIKEGLIKKVVSHVKPLLNDKQKNERVEFFINHINLPCLKFACLKHTIHIDEKWFYLKKVNQTIYLGPKESKPVIKTQNKWFLKKVMFLV